MLFPLVSHKKENETPCTKQKGYIFTGCFNEWDLLLAMITFSFRPIRRGKQLGRCRLRPLHRALLPAGFPFMARQTDPASAKASQASSTFTVPLGAFPGSRVGRSGRDSRWLTTGHDLQMVHFHLCCIEAVWNWEGVSLQRKCVPLGPSYLFIVECV